MEDQVAPIHLGAKGRHRELSFDGRVLTIRHTSLRANAVRQTRGRYRAAAQLFHVIRTDDYTLIEDDGSVIETIPAGQVLSVDVSRPAIFRRGTLRIELWDGRTKAVRFSRHQASLLEQLLAAVIDAGRPDRRRGYRRSNRPAPPTRPRSGGHR